MGPVLRIRIEKKSKMQSSQIRKDAGKKRAFIPKRNKHGIRQASSDQQRSFNAAFIEWPKIHVLENEEHLLARWQIEKQKMMQNNEIQAPNDGNVVCDHASDQWPKIYVLENEGHLLARWQAEKLNRMQNNDLKGICDDKSSALPKLNCLENQEHLLARWNAECQAKKQLTIKNNNKEASSDQEEEYDSDLYMYDVSSSSGPSSSLDRNAPITETPTHFIIGSSVRRSLFSEDDN